MNYLAIEHNGECMEHVLINNNDGVSVFDEILDMEYADIVAYEDIEEFVFAVMCAVECEFDDDNDQTMVTLIDGNDNTFIWSIIIGSGDNEDELKYVFVDWKKDEKNYKYSEETY